jgi:hypothetical protein
MKILNKLLAEIIYDNSVSGLDASTVQEAIDKLYALLLAQEQQFFGTLDGGAPDSEQSVFVDGGEPSDNGV